MNVENLKELTLKRTTWDDVVEKGKTHVSVVKLMQEEEGGVGGGGEEEEEEEGGEEKD
jgi:hypothetical protein